MTATRVGTLALLTGVGAVFGWSVMRVLESSGGSMPLPMTALVAMLVIAAAVLVVGWPVRRWNHGDRSRRLDPLRAARTVVLAKAADHSGALLAGWYLGQGLTVVGDLDIEPRRDRLVLAGLAVLAALAMVVAGLVVERWCKFPEGPGDDPDLDEDARDHHPSRH